MSELISWEWKFFAIAVMWGMVLSIVYDVLRIIRRVIVHKKVWPLALEDILFWMVAGVAMFHVIFMVNDGIIRSFALLAFALGSAMYQYTVSYYFVRYVSRFIIFLRRILYKIIKRFLILPLKKLIELYKIRYDKIKKKQEIHKGEVKESNEKVRDKTQQRATNKKTKTF